MGYARAGDGARIHYEAFGRRGAPAVLMIQGLGADKHGWDMQRFMLARSYRVIAFDNRGAGRSDKPFGVYSLEQMADDAVAVLDHVDVDAAHVVGASMGGAISQLMAVRHPYQGAVTDAGVHRLPQPAVAPRAARAMDVDSAGARHGRHDRRGRPLGHGSAIVPPPRTHVRLARAAGDGPPDPLVRRPGPCNPGGRRRARR